MPRVPSSAKDQAFIADRIRSELFVEVAEIRRGLAVEAAMVVEDKGLTTPFGLPIFIRIEIKDM